jgi:hypothetical protein
VEEAALAARKKNIAKLVSEARLDASKKIVQLAKKKAWISDSEFKKLATALKRKKEPLKTTDLEMLQKKMRLSLQ